MGGPVGGGWWDGVVGGAKPVPLRRTVTTKKSNQLKTLHKKKAWLVGGVMRWGVGRIKTARAKKKTKKTKNKEIEKWNQRGGQ